MSEFEELVRCEGVLMAKRFGPDGRVAEHKADRWYIRNPVAAQMATWFCGAITAMLSSLAYAIVVGGDRFFVAERAKVARLDERDRLVGNRQP